MVSRPCRKCGGLDRFPSGQCRPCGKARTRATYKKLDAAGRKNRVLHTKYGLSVAQFEEMLSAQHGQCAICLTAPATHVDHDHATGQVRSLLCLQCNTGLGMFKDNSDRMRRAAQYIEERA